MDHLQKLLDKCNQYKQWRSTKRRRDWLVVPFTLLGAVSSVVLFKSCVVSWVLSHSPNMYVPPMLDVCVFLLSYMLCWNTYTAIRNHVLRS